MPVAHKSAISVGLLYIPVGMYKTTRNASISFNQLCKDSKERRGYDIRNTARPVIRKSKMRTLSKDTNTRRGNM